jgi:hypothetical protein
MELKTAIQWMRLCINYPNKSQQATAQTKKHAIEDLATKQLSYQLEEKRLEKEIL